MTKTQHNLWRDALSFRFDTAELLKRHGKELVIFSKRDYDRMLKALKKHPEALKTFQKLNIYMTPMDISLSPLSPKWKPKKHGRNDLR